MYKVIYENVIIDVLKEVRYAKYLTNSKRTIITNSTSANCIIASNRRDKYHVNGMPYPKGCNLKTVSLIKISEDEYIKLMETVTAEDNFVGQGILNMKKAKIEEMRDVCNREILEGVSVVLSDNDVHHFTMSLEDQLNLLEIRYLIDNGQDIFIYHETNGANKEYHSNDMKLIINALFENKQKHLLHFNRLKQYITSLTNAESVSAVQYGMKV